MPELPEIETICTDLKKILINKKIIFVKINRKDLRIPICDRFVHAIVNVIPKKIYRRAKYIVMDMGCDGLHLVFHFGMTGKFIYNAEPGKYDHLVFFLEDNNTLNFNDPRRFGGAFITYDIKKALSDLGPEPLEKNYTGNDFFQSIKNRTTEIKNILINGKIIAGIGNIYACESLFEAKIWPFRVANSLTKIECKILVTAIKRTLKRAIENRGTTFNNYRGPFNEIGNFQNLLQIYNQKKCKICNSDIVKVAQFSRNTFYCRTCQSPPPKMWGNLD